jgi:hypothetical protein
MEITANCKVTVFPMTNETFLPFQKVEDVIDRRRSLVDFVQRKLASFSQLDYASTKMVSRLMLWFSRIGVFQAQESGFAFRERLCFFGERPFAKGELESQALTQSTDRRFWFCGRWGWKTRFPILDGANRRLKSFLKIKCTFCKYLY